MPSTSTDQIAGIGETVAQKAPCVAVTNADITLSGEQTVNSVAVTAGQRVLVKDQASASENGIWVVSTGNWTRAKDFNEARDVTNGTLVAISSEDPITFYRLSPDASPIVIGTTGLTFSSVGVAGPTGTTFDFEGDYNAGTTYTANDIVKQDGSSWRAKIATTGNAPPTLPTESNTQWELVASKGDTGTTGAKGDTGDTGSAGSNGSNGVDGADGFFPGLRYTFSDTVTDADPGAGYIRFNNATFASITQLYIDNLDRDGETTSDMMDLWDDVSNAVARGFLDVYKSTDVTAYRKFRITGAVTDETGYRKVLVTPVTNGSAGTISADDNVVLFFQQSGSDGAGAVDSVNGNTGAVVLDTDDISEGTTNKYVTAAQKAKVDHLTVTQAVDLDQMETDIAALENGMVYKGGWDASAGTFPGGGSAQTGWFYYVSVGGTVDSVAFAAGDNIVATTDSASTSTYAANWSKHDQTDAVQSVAGKTGAVTLVLADVTDAGTAAALDEATTAQFRSNTADKAVSTDQVWAAADEVTLTDAASIAVDMTPLSMRRSHWAALARWPIHQRPRAAARQTR